MKFNLKITNSSGLWDKPRNGSLDLLEKVREHYRGEVSAEWVNENVWYHSPYEKVYEISEQEIRDNNLIPLFLNRTTASIEMPEQVEPELDFQISVDEKEQIRFQAFYTLEKEKALEEVKRIVDLLVSKDMRSTAERFVPAKEEE